MSNKLPMIKREVLEKYKGKTINSVVKGEHVSSQRVIQAINHYGIHDQFRKSGKSEYVVPSYKITVKQVSKYYSGTVSEAAKALGCEYNTFMKGVKRFNLLPNFKGNAGDPEKHKTYYCPFCRENVVTMEYKQCDPCKNHESKKYYSRIGKVKDTPPPDIECRVIKPGDKDFNRIAAQCTPISEIPYYKAAGFIDRVF